MSLQSLPSDGLTPAAATKDGAYHRDAHDWKYDRQMRLWGGHGQKALETSNVLVLGSSAAAAEALKNLVLANIGQYTVVDDAKVSLDDLGSNFYLLESSLSHSRSQSLVETLTELNPDSRGTAVDSSAQQYVEKLVAGGEDGSAMQSYNLVIVATNTLTLQHIAPLSQLLHTANIPLLVVRSIGFLSSIRLQAQNHGVVESHPQQADALYDLYLHPQQLSHIPELQQYIAEYADVDDKSAYDDEAHAHIPYIVLLVKYLQKYSDQHHKLPTTYAERTAFKELIRSASRGDEINYDEAVENTRRVVQPYELHSSVQKLLSNSAITTPEPYSSDFQYCCAALRDFLQHHNNNLPVSPSIPDMHCRSEYYAKIKQIYQTAAERDEQEMQQRVKQLLQQHGRSATIDPAYIQRFVRNVRQLRWLNTRTIAEELQNIDVVSVQQQLEEEIEDSYVHDDGDAEKTIDDGDEAEVDPSTTAAAIRGIDWYIGLRAVDQFQHEHYRMPGRISEDETVDADEAAEADYYQLEPLAQQIHKQCQLPAEHELSATVLQELVRCGGTELCSTSSFIGGVCSQLAMQLLMRQYMPINHTFIHNAISCKSHILQT